MQNICMIVENKKKTKKKNDKVNNVGHVIIIEHSTMNFIYKTEEKSYILRQAYLVIIHISTFVDFISFM